MLMPGRKYAATNGYRYGFNGKENDNEVAENGNSIHYEFREYDPRIGRFRSIDPRSAEYVWQSPYVYHRNNPINAVDFMGLGDPPKLNWDYFSKRHILSGDFGVNTPSGGVNSIVTNPAWQNKSTIEGFFKEAMTLAQGKTETNVTLKNGTTWSINTKTGHFNPISGEGITNLSNAEVAVLRATKKSGVKGEAIFENIGRNKSLTGTFSEGMQTAMNSLAKIEGVSDATALKHIGGRMTTNTTVTKEASNAATSQFGKASKFVKWGGRALLVVAVAADVYEIYNSENKARTITKKIGGWAGAAAGGSVGASWGASVGTVAPGAGNIIGGALGGLAGGIIGYWVGETVTETVYDWIFTKEK